MPMPDKKFIIAFLGYPCSGKSTAGRLIAKHTSGIYRVSTDTQKWLLSGYDRNSVPVPIREITFGLFEAVCKAGLPIQLEYIRTEEDYNSVKEVADKYGYTMHCFEFLTPRDVLIERFHKRLDEAAQGLIRISVKTEDAFLAIVDRGYYAPKGIEQFDTTKVSMEEIADRVMATIQ